MVVGARLVMCRGVYKSLTTIFLRGGIFCPLIGFLFGVGLLPPNQIYLWGGIRDFRRSFRFLFGVGYKDSHAIPDQT